MTNEIVKYDNHLNDIMPGNLTSNEWNLFISLIQQARDKNDQKIVIPFEKLQSLSKYNRHAQSFIDDLRTINNKLLQQNTYSTKGERIQQFNCFDLFEINKKAKTLTIQINHEFLSLFNNLHNWTRFQLKEFVELKSSYAKNLYRLIKQFRTTGFLRLTKEQLIDKLDLPQSYIKSTSNLKRHVLQPVKEELVPIIPNFAIKAIHQDRQGHPVVAYKFTWQKEEKNADDRERPGTGELKRELNNISSNDSLTDKERKTIYRKVLKSKASTDTKNKQLRDMFNTWIKYYQILDQSIIQKLLKLATTFGASQTSSMIQEMFKNKVTPKQVNIDKIPVLIYMELNAES